MLNDRHNNKRLGISKLSPIFKDSLKNVPENDEQNNHNSFFVAVVVVVDAFG